MEDRRLLAILTVTTEQDVVDGSDGLLSLREAVESANLTPGPDDIRFNFGHDGPAIIRLSGSELLINDSLTITGDGPDLLTIDAGNGLDREFNTGDGWRIFHITNDLRDEFFEVQISGMTLTGGDTDDLRGGAIHSRENLTVSNTVITGNAVTRNALSSGGWGGGIQSLYGNLTVTDSTISSNVALVSGGAIDFNSVNRDTSMLLSNVTLIDNDADSGGALLLAGDTTILDSEISDNEAVRGGGISVYFNARRPEISIRNSLISGNTATWGGGFYNKARSSNFEFVGSTVTGNTALVKGGGIYLGHSTAGSGGPQVLTFVGGEVSNNSAGQQGGGFFVEGSAEVTIQDSTISQNHLTQVNQIKGGGIYSYSQGELSIDGVTIEQNDGFALWAAAQSTLSPITISNSHVLENEAGIYLKKFSTSLQDTVIAGNEGFGLTISRGETNLDRVEVLNNFGGGVSLDLTPTTISSSNISGNGSLENSSRGGIYHAGSDLVIQRSTLSGNQSSSDGGGIYSRAGSNLLRIESSAIFDNTSQHHGGGISSSNPVEILQSTIHGNQTLDPTALGAGVLADRGLVLIQSTVTNNANLGASSRGGGLWVGGLTMEGSIVAGNLSGSTAPDIAAGTPFAVQYSLIGDSSSLTPQQLNLLNAYPGNLLDVDPLLDPLADNGGPTFTRALLEDSPALDTGHPFAYAGKNGVPEFDQRGAPFGRVFGGRIDIGAFEVQPAGGSLTADFDQDGDVDGADFLIWQRGYKSFAAMLGEGDATTDGDVDQFDLQVWEALFGTMDSESPLNSAMAVENSLALAGHEKASLAATWDQISEEDAVDFIAENLQLQEALLGSSTSKLLASSSLTQVNERGSTLETLRQEVPSRDHEYSLQLTDAVFAEQFEPKN